MDPVQTRNFEFTQGPCLPVYNHLDCIFSLGQGHTLNQVSQKLFAFHVRGGGGFPDGPKVLCQSQDAGSFFRTGKQARWLWPVGVGAFQLVLRNQFLVPVPLQAASNQSVVRIHGSIASPGQVSLVAGSFDAQLPLLFDLPGAGFDLLQRGQ